MGQYQNVVYQLSSWNKLILIVTFFMPSEPETQKADKIYEVACPKFGLPVLSAERQDNALKTELVAAVSMLRKQ